LVRRPFLVKFLYRRYGLLAHERFSLLLCWEYLPLRKKKKTPDYPKIWPILAISGLLLAVHFVDGAAAVAIMVAVGLLVHPNGQTKAQKIGIMMGLASAVTFALFGRLSQKLGHQGGAAWISCLQNIIVMLAILPVLWLVAPAPPQPPDWIWLILLGVVTTALMHQLYFYALQQLSATLCSAFVALEPVYAIVFAAWFFNEPLTP